MCTAATVVASNADRVDRADQRRPIESAKSINYYTGSRAIVRRTACVEQCEGDVLPALSFELADDPNCFCSIKKAHILKACARLAQVYPSCPTAFWRQLYVSKLGFCSALNQLL